MTKKFKNAYFFPKYSLLKDIAMKKFNLLLALIFIFSSLLFSQGVTKVGTTVSKFLSIDVGSRATGFGSAFVSVADDASAMYWNPSGITQINNIEVAFINSRWLADLSFNYAGVVIPVEGFGTLGINATFLTMDPIERTTTDKPDGTGEMVDAGSYAFGLVYARKLTDQFSIGFNFKLIYERVYQSSATGAAVDIGTLFDTKLYGLKLGMSISNFGTKMELDGKAFQVQHDPYPNVSGNNENINAKLSTDQYDLPLNFRLGVSMDVLKGLYNSNLILSIDALHPSDDVESINVGGEFIFQNTFAVRAGWKDIFKKDTQQSVVFGGGIRYDVAGMQIIFDYSYIYFGCFPDISMFSFGLRF